MRRNSREISPLSLSALDLFATAMGAFAIIMLILFPHYAPVDDAPPPSDLPLKKNPRANQPFENSLGMKFVPIATGPGAWDPPASDSRPLATPPPAKQSP